MERAMAGYGLLVSAWMERELTRAEGAILRERTHRLAEQFGTLMEARFRSGRGVADYCRGAVGHPHPSEPDLQGGRRADLPMPC